MTTTDAGAARYRQAKTLAWQALDRPAGERARFVQSACGSDAQLLQEVRWLIEAAQNDGADTVTLDLLAATADAAPINVEAPLPRNYRLLHRLGEGGMGVVYLAERQDGDLSQQVALKLLRLDADLDPAMARRFTSERRILAGLNHRNIAHLIDGGITADGRPFLAMEHVDGERIDVWCQQHARSLKARIELFLKVCDAVDYAHRHLVIHRDIKPANILVDADGEPKLLDFGIARLLGNDDAVDTLRTDSGMRALTLAYASPEQIEGGPLSTATDIYSLGIVLYQMVTGARPFDHLQTAHLLSNAIVSGEITPPSRLAARLGDTRVTDRSVDSNHRDDNDAAVTQAEPVARKPRWRWPRPGVPRDVDAIVLKALRREPVQRYASVADLAADLRRFLSSRPVRARRGHWPYRLRRFAWRWRWALTAIAAFALLLTGFIVDREAQLRSTQVQRDRAEAVAAFMNDLFENADSLRSRGNQVTVREMLDRGAQTLLQRDDLDQALRRSMLLAMGRAYNALGLGQQALPLLQSAQALESPADDTVTERVEVLAQLSEAHSSRRETSASIAADAQAIEMLRNAEGDHDDDIIRLRIRKLHNQGNVLDLPLAETRRQLHAILDELLARPEPPDRLLIQAYRALTVAYSHDDSAEQAVTMAERTLAIAQRHYQADDPRLLSTRFAHAMAMGQLDPARAVGLHQSLIPDYQRLIGPGLNLASVWSNLGVTLSLLGRSDESLDAFQRAADMVRETAGTGHPLYRLAIANIATLHNQTGEPARARDLILEVLPVLAAEAAQDGGIAHVNHAGALKILADADVQLGRAGPAEQQYVQAERILKQADSSAYGPTMAGILTGLADSQLMQRRYVQAGASLDRLDALNKTRQLAPEHADRLAAAILHIELLNDTDAALPAQRLAVATKAASCRATNLSTDWQERLHAASTMAQRNVGSGNSALPGVDCTAVDGDASSSQ